MNHGKQMSRRRWSPGSWFERVVVLAAAVAIGVALATGTAEGALLAVVIAIGAIGIRAAFAPPPAAPARGETRPGVLVVDVSERGRAVPPEARNETSPSELRSGF